ncbi:hypothetical protein [Streptomyces sp. NBC_01579]|uniref:hypothetical protein n=1 Tax=Streptomyces sp. NBC_01579 TaxID=2975885 RepID=UPI003866579E
MLTHLTWTTWTAQDTIYNLSHVVPPKHSGHPSAPGHQRPPDKNRTDQAGRPGGPGRARAPGGGQLNPVSEYGPWPAVLDRCLASGEGDRTST